MSENPPKRLERLLARTLGRSEITATILGDLREDFARHRRDQGPHRARWWYCREAIAMSLGHFVHQTWNRLFGREQPTTARNAMRPTWSPEGLANDARFALRTVRKDLRFFFFAMLIVGLGVGASTAIFSIVSPLLLRPLAFPESDRLVWIPNNQGQGGMSSVTTRTSIVRDLRGQTQTLDGLTAFDAFFEQQSYNLVGGGEPERLVGVSVARNFLDVLGVRPIVGGNFTSDQDGPWFGPSPIILTHAFWIRRFDGDPGVLGTALSLNDQPCEVVGVLPPWFDFASIFAPTTRVDFLRLMPLNDESDQWGNTASMIGRLAPGVTAAQAQADLDLALQRLRDADPNRWGLRADAHVIGLQEHLAGPYRSALLLLVAGALAVMLIVCLNLSNLLLVKGSRRGNEMVVRAALGASRGRLMRQMMIESLIMAVGGGLLGTLIAVVATRAIAASHRIEIPLLRDVGVDAPALFFSAAMALACGLLVGLIPAVRASGGHAASTIRVGPRRMSAGRRDTRFREFLVVGEVALACVLLVFGGLLLKSFQRVLDVDLGFRPAGVVTWQLNTTRSFETLPEMSAFYDQMIENVLAVPGVDAAGLTDAVPLGRNRGWTVGVPGVTYERGEQPQVFPHVVDHRYTATMGIPLLAGRPFSSHDTPDREPVLLLNETASQVLFPGTDPIGSHVTIGDHDLEVVGVVADVRHRKLEKGAGSEIYLPISQVPDFATLDLVVRSHLPVDVLAPAVSAALRQTDPTMPTQEFRSLDSIVDRAVSPRRFTAALLLAFAGTALILAALGIYGVLSYTVTQRIPEIGIRMALGASAASVLRRLVGRTLFLATVGVAIGAVVAVSISRLLSGLLYGVTPTDPATFVAMSLILLVVAALAGLRPALTAARTDSVQVLQRL